MILFINVFMLKHRNESHTNEGEDQEHDIVLNASLFIIRIGSQRPSLAYLAPENDSRGDWCD